MHTYATIEILLMYRIKNQSVYVTPTRLFPDIDFNFRLETQKDGHCSGGTCSMMIYCLIYI